MILALETATNICSVSFANKAGKIHEKRTERKGSHSEYLFLFIRELMAEQNFQIKDLDVVLVSNGPGSYTGLRIAASAVKGMLFDSDVEVYAANTLAGFAVGGLKWHKQTPEEAEFGGVIHAVINARRSHLYHQEFRFEQNLEAVTEPMILDLKEIEKIIQPGNILVGSGIDRLSETSRSRIKEYGLETVTAASLISLFESEPGKAFFTKTTAEELESNYISSSQV